MPSNTNYVIRPRKVFSTNKEMEKEFLHSDNAEYYVKNGEKRTARSANSTDAEEHEKAVGCTENFHQYLMNSTLHGLRYVGETHISVFERVFFALSFVMVVILSIYFISNIYQKWTASPIIIALNSVATSIRDIPFPAVTICNMNQARKSRVSNIKPKSRENILLQNLCRQTDSMEETIFPPDYSGKWSMFKEFLINVSQPCSEMLVQCRYAAETIRCMELFNTVLTDDGLCCTFNSVHPRFLLKNYNDTDEFDSVSDTGNVSPVKWTPEDGWQPDTQRSTTYPRAGAGAGSHMGLVVILNADEEDYYCSSTNSIGFKVLLHSPIETPRITDYGFSITPGEETRVVITPRISDASRLIRNIPRYQRQCVFLNEGNLSYFQTYSLKNCEKECQSRKIEEACDCVQYYMPRINEDTNICSQRDLQCFMKINLAIELGLNETYQCTCMPGCFEIYYRPEVFTSKLGDGKFTVREKLIAEMDPEILKSSISVLHIFYEENFFRSFTKEELIGFTEFLSNTGGLLGLFMGFSMVSVIEIFYFISLRPYCAHRRYLEGMRHTTNGTNSTTTQPQKTNKNVRIVEPATIINYTNGSYNVEDAVNRMANKSAITKSRFTTTYNRGTMEPITLYDKSVNWILNLGTKIKDTFQNLIQLNDEKVIIDSNNAPNGPFSSRYPYTE